MPIEIERKFLLKDDSWRTQVSSSARIRQGYLAPVSKASVRVRLDGERANINIKSATLGVRRMEYEYFIPVDEAVELLDQLCQTPQINKTRFKVEHAGYVWEIDEFYGDNEGLIVAEIELDDESESFEKPVWLGEEVSGDARYYNVNLAKQPFKNW